MTADVMIPLVTGTLAVLGVVASLGACVHAYRSHPQRDDDIRIWSLSGLSTAVVTTLEDFAQLERRDITTHLLALSQVSLAVASVIEYRVEGTMFHLLLAGILTASTTALVAFDALAPRPDATR